MNYNRLRSPDEVPSKGKAREPLAVERFPTPSSPVAGPSPDGLGGQIEHLLLTPPPINSTEDELARDEMTTTPGRAPAKSDPLFQWEDDIEQDAREEEQMEKPE